MVVSAAEVVSFWHEAGPDRWFNKDAAFDKAIHERFSVPTKQQRRGSFPIGSTVRKARWPC